MAPATHPTMLPRGEALALMARTGGSVTVMRQVSTMLCCGFSWSFSIGVSSSNLIWSSSGKATRTSSAVMRPLLVATMLKIWFSAGRLSGKMTSTTGRGTFVSYCIVEMMLYSSSTVVSSTFHEILTA